MSHHFEYEVGDEYEGSPILASKFISQVQSVGGLVEIDGNIVRIVYLPASVHGEEKVLDRYKDEAPDATPVPGPEAVVPASEVAEVVAEAIDDIVETVEEVAEAHKEEILATDEAEEVTVEDLQDVASLEVEAPKPASKRGRPRKTVEE